MKKILSMALVCLLAFGAGIYASSNLKVVEATLASNLNIKIFNEKFTPKEADGTELVPLLYNGRTYLPVRAVVEKFGYEVGWEAETSTVTVNEKDEAVGISVLDLPLDDYLWETYSSTQTLNLGDLVNSKYSNGIRLDRENSTDKVDIILGGKYSTLTFDVSAVEESSKEVSNGYLNFYDKSRDLHIRTVNLTESHGKTIEVDVRGIDELRFVGTTVDNLEVVLLDPIVNSEVTMSNTALDLSDVALFTDEIPVYDIKSTTYLTKLTKDTQYLKNYKYGVVSSRNASNTNYMNVELNKEYSLLKADIDFTKYDETSMVVFYDEDRNLLAKYECKAAGVQAIEVPVEGVKTLILKVINKVENDVILGELRFLK